MDFIGVGGWEILLVLVIALIILGPSKLPEFARNIGKITRALKKASFDLTTAVTRELEDNEKSSSSSQPKRDTGDKSDAKKS
jgi:Tat protein translocase TatB subunit